MIAFRAFLISLANNGIDSFAGAINRARGTCWVRACAPARDRERLAEIPEYDLFLVVLVLGFIIIYLFKVGSLKMIVKYPMKVNR